MKTSELVDAPPADPVPVQPLRVARRIDPSDQALFFLPTAFTPPKGSFTFRDFELLFLTLGFAPTGSTSLTGGFLFPVTSEVQLLTLGFKQGLWMDPGARTAVALTGSITKPFGEFAEDAGFLVNSNLVASHRLPIMGVAATDGAGIHAAVGYLGASSKKERSDGSSRTDWSDNFSLGAGAEARLTDHAKLMVEFLTAAPFDADNDIEGGLLTLGFRLHGERLAADIAGLRPTGEDMGDLFLWPLLVVSYRF